MMTNYAVTLARRYDGLFTATFPDVPGVAAFGRDDDEALEEAEKALRAAIARCEASGDPLPEPTCQGRLTISIEDSAAQASAAQAEPPLMQWSC